MTTPDIITPVSGSSPQTDDDGSWETGVYQYNSTVGTKEIYSLSFPQADGSYTNMGINSAIYVETSGASANTWYDYTTTSDPLTVTDTGTQIKLYNSSGSLMITLPKPTTASWISSGPGTLSTNVAVGSFYDVSSTHFSYKVDHSSAFSTSQTYQLHSTTLTPSFISDLVVGAPALSTNSRTHNWTIPDVVEIRDNYYNVLASLTLGQKRKVFCNFW